MQELPFLSLVIWTPILGGVWILLASGARNAPSSRSIALLVSLVTFALSLPLWSQFETGTHAMQFQEKSLWIDAFAIYYHLGVDGISMPLIILTTFTTVLVVLAGWEVIQYKPDQYMAAFLVLEGLMIGAFSALDAMLFYVFWEALLIPMFLIIGVWGGPQRIYATVKFFLYTFFGSVFMLVALIYLYRQAGTFSILAMHDLPIGLHAQVLIFFAFLVAFAVKVPMWPVHTWLPDAHVEAPTGGSVILAAVMLKLGAYGFLRFSLPITPDASHALDWLMIALSLIAIVYIGFVALVQPDMKKLIAYSSIAHMGFATLGFFIAFRIMAAGDLDGAILGVEGGIVQLVSHGFISGALFLCVGVMYDRMHSRMIADYGGVVNRMPVFAAFMMLFALANSGLPGTSGFVGEFMVILSSFKTNFWIAFLAATTLVLGAAYSLWMYKRVIYGSVANEQVAALDDIGMRETFVLGALAAAVLLLGVWPAPLLEVMGATVEHLLAQMTTSKL
ncbi:MAG: NADH-quinone oxidoreductase subunit M [Gammaproteobacteria bacterium]|nr:NADH-quinone oxidoreductase subunit M [Gammaproteobacteria bacterium]NIM73909.1 NADH-quinone oxidoreductase subunit M [Gammaproteobacteria bacterium]NIN38097.1 NADH-quinone oxidoreductase subunit M [Gammaproteobacteria bacterium]NIO25690.1 NADH-quinone oxidoreductase subunit M [Gammaproteobacteria bacterium]NIO66324.1 NADH-quinone oxidoreductase subunit M [Gammaproteobacteria bacterium]